MKPLMLGLVLLLSSMAMAQESVHPAGPVDPHPAISQDSTWAGSMVIIVVTMFIAAAVIGPVVRACMPPAPPDVPLHDMHADADVAHGHGHGH
ncbi:MAG TPA: hypothetical protein VHD56_01760 [Tepidisphaeraceae bacterium]|nr:hypothetical protein [Tepidisphaeraceae bacterium]